MVTDAYQLSLVAVLCGLCAAVLRARLVRPGISLFAAVLGMFFLGFAVSGLMHRSNSTWGGAAELRAPEQSAGAAQGESVLALAPDRLARGIALRRGDKIGVDIFDVASAGVPSNQPHVDLPAGAQLRLAGWAADSGGNGPCKKLYLGVGRRRFALPYGIARQDVAEFFHNRSFTMTGYAVQLSARTLGAGTHTLTLECLSADGKTLFLSNKPYTVTVE